MHDEENAELEGERRGGDPDAQIYKKPKPKMKKKPVRKPTKKTVKLQPAKELQE